MAVRQHLGHLEPVGLVANVGASAPLSRGRPENLWAITPQGLDRIYPKRYGLLAELMLSELQDDELLAVCDCAAQRYLLSLNLKGTGTFDERLQLLVKTLEGLGACPEVQQRQGQYAILLRNCILLDLVLKFPQVCRFYQALAAEIMGVWPQVQRVEGTARKIHHLLLISKPI